MIVAVTRGSELMLTASCVLITSILRAAIAVTAVYFVSFAMAPPETDIVCGAEITIITWRVLR